LAFSSHWSNKTRVLRHTDVVESFPNWGAAKARLRSIAGQGAETKKMSARRFDVVS
jgi:hypothetical protein